jgi:hypothetical protein
VNGFNSQLVEWGWEDIDFLVRLRAAVGLRHESRGRAVHLGRADATANRDAMRASENANFMRCLVNYHAGCFEGTYVEDVVAWASRVTLHEGWLT